MSRTDVKACGLGFVVSAVWVGPLWALCFVLG